MRIYVACLASYNNGVLYGRWIDASSDADEMMEEVSAMLKASPIPGAEEWAIHDYEDFPDLGEHVGLETIAKFVELVEEYDHSFKPTEMAAIVDHFGDIEEAARMLEDNLVGPHDSFLEYASDYADECLLGDASEVVAAYFNYEAFARDLKMDYEVVDLPSGGVAIFLNH